ncbi:MAG: hypothetical protein NZ481_10045, partial [Candidatus Kapabacteria bacterium]|nr:hypothetical protein [Candidatus Kapabacteria bacterium]
TTFGAAGASDATVSGTYNALDIQLKPGSVGSSEIADGSIQPVDVNLGGTWNFTGTLQQGGNAVLTTATTFGAAGASDATVSGTYNALNIQLNPGVVGNTELAANAVATGNIQNNAVTYAKLQNAGGPNRLLVSGSSAPYGWGELSGPTTAGQVLTYNGTNLVWQAVSGTVPNGTADGQLLRWNQSASAWEAVELSAGSGISITNNSSGITITNTGDVNAGDDLTTTTTFGAAGASDATVSGTYNALDIQLK